MTTYIMFSIVVVCVIYGAVKGSGDGYGRRDVTGGFIGAALGLVLGLILMVALLPVLSNLYIPIP